MSIEIFHGRPHIDFVGNRWICFILSGALLGTSILLLATRGINYAIDFTGGSLLQLTYEAPQTVGGLRTDLAKAGYGEASVQHFTGTNTFAIRLKGDERESAAVVDDFLKSFASDDPAKKFRVDRKEYVGPTVGRHLFKQAMFAVVFSLVGIVVYVAFRFSNLVWGVAGILALGHDVLSMFGLFSLFQMEFDLVLVAAVLTIAGFSINDTIVIFDRMREKMRMSRGDLPLAQVINDSVNETLSRTIITSFTVLMTVAALTFLGGPVLFDFSSSLLFGLLVGSYSTIAIAAPIVYQWETGGWKTKPAPLGPARPSSKPESPDQPGSQSGARPDEGDGPGEGRRSRRERRKDRR